MTRLLYGIEDYLEDLSHESIYEFAFIGACLKIRGGTGSPMRPIALPLRS